MSDQPNLIDRLSEPFPPHAIEKRQGGGNQWFDYVATETVIRRLNKVARSWDFRITDKHIQEGLLVIWGELTIPGLGTRSGTGVQKLQGGEDMWKGAASDCLKKCATLFNVGIDLYGPDLEAGELPEQPNLPARARSTTQNPIPKGSDVPAPSGEDPWTTFWREAKAAGLNDWTHIAKAIGSGQDAFRNGSEALEALRAKTQAVTA